MNHPSRARLILQSFFLLAAGEAIARLVNFAAFAHLARVLGRSSFGLLGLVITIVSYLQIPVMQGFDSVGIRDVARERKLLSGYAGNIIVIRVLSAAFTWLALAAVVWIVQPEYPIQPLLLLFSLTLFANAISLKWTFQAVDEMRPVALAGIASQMAFAAGAFTVTGPQYLLLVPIYQLGGEAAATAMLAVAYRRRGNPLWLAVDWQRCRKLLGESAPLAVSTVLGTLLFNFDVLALAKFQTAAAVGLYTAVYKLVLLFATLLTLFQLSIFPTLSRAHASLEGFAPIGAKILRYLAAAFVPLAFAGLLMARRWLVLLFGADYAAGAVTLQILMWSLVPMALRSVFRIILVSSNHQRLDMRAVTAGAITNIILDLALAPRFSTVGTAISTLSSEIVILALSYGYVWSAVEPIFILRHLLRPLIASAVMLAAAWKMALAPLVAQAAVAAVVYIGALFLMRAISWKEIATLYQG